MSVRNENEQLNLQRDDGASQDPLMLGAFSDHKNEESSPTALLLSRVSRKRFLQIAGVVVATDLLSRAMGGMAYVTYRMSERFEEYEEELQTELDSKKNLYESHHQIFNELFSPTVQNPNLSPSYEDEVSKTELYSGYLRHLRDNTRINYNPLTPFLSRNMPQKLKKRPAYDPILPPKLKWDGKSDLKLTFPKSWWAPGVNLPNLQPEVWASPNDLNGKLENLTHAKEFGVNLVLRSEAVFKQAWRNATSGLKMPDRNPNLSQEEFNEMLKKYQLEYSEALRGVQLPAEVLIEEAAKRLNFPRMSDLHLRGSEIIEGPVGRPYEPDYQVAGIICEVTDDDEVYHRKLEANSLGDMKLTVQRL